MKGFVAFVCDRLSLAVVAICSVFMLLVFVSVEVDTTQVGSYGIKFRGDTDLVDLASGVTQGALQSGDRIDLTALTPKARFSFLTYAPEQAHLAIRAQRQGASFPVTLSATPPVYTRQAALARDIGNPLCFFLSLGLASALLLIRPRPSTLAFYTYAILMLLKVYQVPLALAVWPMNLVSDLLMQLIYPLTQLMILVFAQRLYGHRGRTWPWLIWSAVAISAIDCAAWLNPILWVTFQRFYVAGPTRLFEALCDAVLLCIVLCGLAYIASGADGIARRRVTWIVAGIALAPILDLTWALADIASALVRDSSATLQALESWTDALLPWFGLLGIVAVLYGFLSRRIVDFRVAVSRAALYGGTTIAIVALFGAIEWLAEQIFESTRPAMYVSLVAALVIGFAMRAVHGRFEAFLDGIFFREQHHAEATLQRAARALANTTSETTLVEFLLDEPIAALDLDAAALFLARGADGSFERAAARGWNDDHAERFGPEDSLIVALRSELGALALDGRLRAGMHLPGGNLESLAVPLVMRGKVFGFVFYGERRDGAAFTGDERALLASIATNAAAAYDHIDANRAHERIHMLEERLLDAGIAFPSA